MKKRLLTIFICFLCLITVFSGCGLGSYIDHNKDKGPSTVTPGGPNNPADPDDPDDPDDPPAENKNYTVTVFYKNQIFNPGNSDVTVVWRNSQSIIRAPLGADGKADAGVLEGDYHVYLEDLPEKYTYDPSGYQATEKERSVTILLLDISTPSKGNGGGPYRDDGCYVVLYDGTYRAKIGEEGQYVYYEYTPTSSGWYKIESWVNVYDDAVDPFLQKYGGTFANKWPTDMCKDGGYAIDGGFTKNFRFDVQVDKSEVGNSFTFAVSAVSKFGNYPINVDFAIVYLGEYQSSYSDVRTIYAQKARGTAKDPKAGEHFEWADMGTKIFSMDNYKFNEDTGYYHRYSMELYGDGSLGYGAGFGPILYCAIKKQIPIYDDLKGTNGTGTFYTANSVQTEMGSVNYLLRYNVWLEDEQKYVTYDYQEFIRSSKNPPGIGYGATCNSDGCCYVTQELKEFLQMFADEYELWSDGVKERGGITGTPETYGYYAKQDALWLFACGFYTK